MTGYDPKPGRSAAASERAVGRRGFRGLVWVLWLVGIALLLSVVAPLAFLELSRGPGLESDRPPSGSAESTRVDTDGDGLPDVVEEAGWATPVGGVHRTNPASADSDADGLSDGEEAGLWLEDLDGVAVHVGLSDPNDADTDGDGLNDAVETGWPPATGEMRLIAFEVSNPRVEDSDGDGIWDGDEFLLDMDPLAVDTDADSLSDWEELEFGSDPTLADADEDGLGDADERDQGSNPLSYDLDSDEKRAAGEAGLKYGDCTECALDAGLRLEQIESPEYLAGHFASGVFGFGDLRDLALNVWKQKFVAAGVAALGLLPIIGDGSKAVSLLTKFAQRGDRAAEAVRLVTEKLPLPTSVKQKVLAALPSRVGRLPMELVGGPTTYVVYRGDDYIGITSDFMRRQAQHARAGRSFVPTQLPGATGLSRGEARAIEQACIVEGGLASLGGGLQNRINSISPARTYYSAALDAGRAMLLRFGAECPVASLP